MIAGSAPPQDAARHEEDTPFKLFTSLDSCTVGGYSTSRCGAKAHVLSRRMLAGSVRGQRQDRGMSSVRYRYRAYPTGDQAQVLARTFGCARVVYNDCLRLRQDAHAGGVALSDTDVQRQVVTLAKTTPEREWLGDV